MGIGRQLADGLIKGASGVVSKVNAGVCVNQFKPKALTLQVVLHALKEQGASVSRCTRANFIGAHPKCSDNALVQRLLGVKGTEFTRKSKPQVGDILYARVIGEGSLKATQVHANQMRGLEVISAFFKRLSSAGLKGRLPRVEVTSWIVQPESFRGVFFNQQKFAVFFNDGSNGNARFPACRGVWGMDLYHGWAKRDKTRSGV